ncbi:MAG: hypothetical protein PHC54_05960 [Candidatus Omnitrophica bacterium]|nr:hypothetical protein [Candidatus Omnitrophota bacterium]MDD5592786.1 hypothetical protein [Candidatus Omnitrophota bacterium]
MDNLISNVSCPGTGDSNLTQESRTIVYPFERFNITVKVSPSNEFVGITEVEINKDFMSYKQKNAQQGYHDVEQFYKE